jgi:FlaA1/EpsC-like NDP-sugar epimerase/lipopolysaccharide/colanic/teichoic acid biosynthesis glycosyltransferase
MSSMYFIFSLIFSGGVGTCPRCAPSQLNYILRAMLYSIPKRLFDFVFSFGGILILSPGIFIIAILIKITSRGPVFFRQVRVGQGGRNFRIFKFRTMVCDAYLGPAVTAKNDCRITSIGKLLRQAKLDEIPQLFNVFYGTMSFVGPRPEIPELTGAYTEEQKRLLMVKPGITSPATIYHRDEEEISGSAEEVLEYHRRVLVPKKAQYDLAYIENRSMLYDLRLILLTLLSVVTNESGYVREKTVKNRRALIVITVIVLLVISYWLAYLIRFEGHIPDFYDWKFKRTLPLIVMLKLVFLAYFGQLEGYWRYVSISDVVAIAKSMFLAAVSILLMEYFFLSGSFPTGTVPIDFMLSLMLLSGQRLSLRLLREAYAPIVPKSTEKVLILGAGDRGERVLRDVRSNPDLGFHVVGFIHPNAAYLGVKIHGIEVIGTFEELPEIVEKWGITSLINTLEPLTHPQTAILTRLRAQFKCTIRNVPSAVDYITGKAGRKKMREVGIEDLLGRKSVKLDVEGIEKELKGKRVMVTGAGGSIGSELVRQIVRFNPGKLLLLDKDETLLYELQTELVETGADVEYEVLIGDIRNWKNISLFFEQHKPEVVLHAAAYKHVPLMEMHPHEAFQNNVFGTKNVLEAAYTCGTERFVMISTDKAVRSTNVMGATKRLSEMLMFRCFAGRGRMKCMAVRFGNVLGSRGSVIPIFQRQINRGGPVRLTHPGITRFFMSIQEAAQLVLQAGAMGKGGGEIFILKMGEPVRIMDLAERLIEFSGFQPGIDIDIEIAGLRPGEKLHEELLTELEGTHTTAHEKILVIDSRQERDEALLEWITGLEEKGLYHYSNNEIKALLKEHVVDYAPQMN